MTTDMRSGDIIKSKRGHHWIVGAVIENGAPIDLAPGRHLLLVRDHDTGNGSELLLALRPECDLRRGHKSNDFEVGYTSARYQGGSVSLLKQDTLYFAVPAPSPTHPFIDTIDGKMLAKAPIELAELFVGLQHDFDDGHSEHLVLRRWQFALLVKRDREGKPPLDFDALEQRLARPEEI
ncbi:hypothetical protein [Mesorhizobium shangrilense]|uniref:Uncharacterized protein n=1 Tax=Mesorhizobium shangrilense TaxID=460060 RepID=A0ABV2DBC5_9HYPH